MLLDQIDATIDLDSNSDCSILLYHISLDFKCFYAFFFKCRLPFGYKIYLNTLKYIHLT